MDTPLLHGIAGWQVKPDPDHDAVRVSIAPAWKLDASNAFDVRLTRAQAWHLAQALQAAVAKLEDDEPPPVVGPMA
jgi:hypothetical protein